MVSTREFKNRDVFLYFEYDFIINNNNKNNVIRHSGFIRSLVLNTLSTLVFIDVSAP